MNSGTRYIPIYLSNGEVGAFMVYPYLYNMQGDWIGWVDSERHVFSVLGVNVGYLSKDQRILCKRVTEDTLPRCTPLAEPPRVYPPANFPLAPLMSELGFNTMDVLMEQPQQLHPTDSGELREDMD